MQHQKTSVSENRFLKDQWLYYTSGSEKSGCSKCPRDGSSLFAGRGGLHSLCKERIPKLLAHDLVRRGTFWGVMKALPQEDQDR